jgi:hypothetical protein
MVRRLLLASLALPKETLMPLRLASLLRTTVLGLSLLAGGVALADVAPPPDAGHTPDMASTMAKPDMSVPVTNNDSGCSMGGHGAAANASALLFGAGALALTLASRRRRLA